MVYSKSGAVMYGLQHSPFTVFLSHEGSELVSAVARSGRMG